jgi:hypothetical protein
VLVLRQHSETLAAVNSWRVDGNDHHDRVVGGTNINARRGWRCPPGTGMWYVGAARNPSALTGLALAMHTWGAQLYANGYMGTLGLRLIIAPPPLDNSPPGSEINPANPGSVVERFYSSPASAPLDPYTFNFRIVDGQYSWDPPVAPLPSPSP